MEHTPTKHSPTTGRPRSNDFEAATQRFRRELLAYCYRIVGSGQDAEDLVQETYLRAWRAYDGFEGRSSIRSWLYEIATNVCSTSLELRKIRVLPSGVTGAVLEANGIGVVAATPMGISSVVAFHHDPGLVERLGFPASLAERST